MGANIAEWLGAITLGDIDATSKTVGDKAYYRFSSQPGSTEFTYAGPVNEGVQIYSDGSFDYRNDILTLYIREQGKTYGQSTSLSIGLTALTYKVERFPLSESADLKIVESDANITSQAPYTGMSITYHQVAQTQNIGGSSYDFGVTINGNDGTAEQIYEFVEYQLRQTSDIDDEADAPTQPGNLQDQLLEFVSDNLNALSVTNADGGGSGVRIINFDSNDTNRIKFIDNVGTIVGFPFVSAGTLSFNTNVVNDTAAKYWLFFTDANGNLVNSDNAIIINDNASVPITGLVSGSAAISFDFDYDGNVQGGRTAATDADFTLRVMGLNTAQFAEVSGTITRSVGQNISITSALERIYLNAA